MPTWTGTWSTGRIPNRAEWLAHPTVKQYHRRARGDRSIETWVTDVALAGIPRERGVGIGAGTGSLELGLLEAGSVGRFDLVDVSSGALDRALQTAEELNVRDRVTTVTGDIDVYDLGECQYDVATCMDSLHHLDELDTVLASVARALVPGGALVAYEYVGPDRFATGPAEREIARRLYRALDPSLRSGSEDLLLPDPVAVIAADPTEAVHSWKFFLPSATISPRCPSSITVGPWPTRCGGASPMMRCTRRRWAGSLSTCCSRWTRP